MLKVIVFYHRNGKVANTVSFKSKKGKEDDTKLAGEEVREVWRRLEVREGSGLGGMIKIYYMHE